MQRISLSSTLFEQLLAQENKKGREKLWLPLLPLRSPPGVLPHVTYQSPCLKIRVDGELNSTLKQGFKMLQRKQLVYIG